jgi:hypothetical protein
MTQPAMTVALALDRLVVLVGEPTVGVGVPWAPTGRTAFELMPGGSFLLRRDEVLDTHVRQHLVIAADPTGVTKTQHCWTHGVAAVHTVAQRGETTCGAPPLSAGPRCREKTVSAATVATSTG